jgi:ubiquinone/menaquinone biosynthesis C-methylase UbiE
MTRRVDFSPNANAYDRRHGAVLSASLAQSLAEAAQLRPGLKVLDVGAGTGRVAIALGGLGCDVVALDPAQAMLHVLQSKVPQAPPRLIAGEGARLPFADTRVQLDDLSKIRLTAVTECSWSCRRS